MDLIKIYQGGNTEVFILDIAAKQVEFLANTYKRLSPIKTEEILSSTLKLLSLQYNLKDKKVITSSEVPILSRKKIFNLSEEYNALEDAVLLLSECFDLTKGKISDEWKFNVKNYIEAYYFLTFQKKCDIIFISEMIKEISLIIVLFEEDNIFILPIILNEDDFYQKLF